MNMSGRSVSHLQTWGEAKSKMSKEIERNVNVHVNENNFVSYILLYWLKSFFCFPIRNF